MTKSKLSRWVTDQRKKKETQENEKNKKKFKQEKKTREKRIEHKKLKKLPRRPNACLNVLPEAFPVRLAFLHVKSRRQESNSGAVQHVACPSRVEDLHVVTFRPETPPKVEGCGAPFLEPSGRRPYLLGEQVLRPARFTRQQRVNRDAVISLVHLPP